MRSLVLTLAFTCFGSLAAAQDLRGEFYALPKAERIALQERLAATGLYQGEIDGLWGPGTAGAVEAARASLAWPSFRAKAREAGAARDAEALWSYLSSPEMSASLAVRR